MRHSDESSTRRHVRHPGRPSRAAVALLTTALWWLANTVPAIAADAPAPVPTAAPPAATSAGVPPEYAVKTATPGPALTLARMIEQVPPLTHDRGDRLPMIMWEAGPFEPQSPEIYRALLARGLTQHIQLTPKHLEIARALQAAGSPVIMMQGGGGPWPAQLAGDPALWAHQFDDGYKPAGYARPCLALHDGWIVEAEYVRTTLRQYRDAGITVDAVWMDWEGDPMYGRDAYEQASHCARCRATLDPAVLATPEAFSRYSKRLTYDLLGTFLAAPVGEVFPRCATTNWMMTISTPDRPLRYWDDRVLAPSLPSWFTATNPVAYGNTVYWKSWQPEWPLDREHVDQFYFHLLLRMVSDDQANAARCAPTMKCYPWVDRWCPDDENPAIPIMSRERYREVLRHLWLRGVDGMQIFQPARPGFEAIVLSEVQDAVAVYDEMLAYREFLDRGEPMSYDVPGPQSDAVVWSGLRLGDRAVVRLLKQGGAAGAASGTDGTGATTPFTFAPWPGTSLTLDVPATGATFVLQRDGTAVKVLSSTP